MTSKKYDLHGVAFNLNNPDLPETVLEHREVLHNLGPMDQLALEWLRRSLIFGLGGILETLQMPKYQEVPSEFIIKMLIKSRADLISGDENALSMLLAGHKAISMSMDEDPRTFLMTLLGRYARGVPMDSKIAKA